MVAIAGRVDEPAALFSWWIVAFTALLVAAATVGFWVATGRPLLGLLGVLPALWLAYVMPLFPLPVAALIFIGGAVVALRVDARDHRGGALIGGFTAATAMLTIALVLVQDPVVSCSDGSSSSGPWWERSNSGSSEATMSPSGDVSGTIRLDDRTYRYECTGNELTRFEVVSDSS